MRDIDDVVSNERLEELRAMFSPSANKDVYLALGEVLALRKEREKAEPVAWLVCGSKTFKDRTASTREVAEQAVKDRNDGSCIKPLYTAPPAPVAAGWIACGERMPVEKDIVLVVDDGYFVCEAQYREGDFFSAARGNNEFFETICRDVEFWQPLPAPPC